MSGTHQAPHENTPYFQPRAVSLKQLYRPKLVRYYMLHPNFHSDQIMFIRAYLRTSTTEQDATRAKQALINFAAER
jgi:hypothetical protein